MLQQLLLLRRQFRRSHRRRLLRLCGKRLPSALRHAVTIIGAPGFGETSATFSPSGKEEMTQTPGQATTTITTVMSAAGGAGAGAETALTSAAGGNGGGGGGTGGDKDRAIALGAGIGGGIFGAAVVAALVVLFIRKKGSERHPTGAAAVVGLGYGNYPGPEKMAHEIATSRVAVGAAGRQELGDFIYRPAQELQG
jgi:hypothetical protein